MFVDDDIDFGEVRPEERLNAGIAGLSGQANGFFP